MDVWTDDRGELHIDPPPTRPGDRFTIEARMPVVVGVTACSAEKSNNGRCTPIDWRVERRAADRAPPGATTFSPDPGTFTFAPERFRCEGEGSDVNLAAARMAPHRFGAQAGGMPSTQRPHVPVLTDLLERLLAVPAPVVLAVVGTLVFIEDALFVGFVVPGETVAILGGVAASLGHVPLWAVLAVVVAAAIVGDSVGFEVGRRLRHPADAPTAGAPRRPPRRRPGPPGPTRGMGRRARPVGRLLPRGHAGARGSTDMRYRTFLVFNALGGVLWATAVVVGGYLAGTSYQAVVVARQAALRSSSASSPSSAGFVVWLVRRRRAGVHRTRPPGGGCRGPPTSAAPSTGPVAGHARTD